MGETPRLTFRPMTLADVESVTALDLRSFGRRDAWGPVNFILMAEDAQTECLVVELDGRIIGCTCAGINSDVAEIETFAIDPDCRRQGIGTLLLIQLLIAVKDRGATFILLEVRPSNTAAIKLYEKLGFRIVEREKDFYPDEDAWVMAREL